jgi:Protein of unknown function (DUF2937)
MGRWLSNTVTLAVALGAAILAMQAPSVTREYLAALQQIAAEARSEVDQSIAAARRQHRIAPTADEQVVAALKAKDAAGAERLALAIEQAGTLRQDQQRLAADPDLRRPVTVAWDAWRSPQGHKRAVLETVLARYEPAIHLDAASALYGLAGLLLGSLLVQLPLALLRCVGRGLWRRRHPRYQWYVPERATGRKLT